VIARSIDVSEALEMRLCDDVAGPLHGVGSESLLNEPLLGFIASRECPGHILIETLDRVPQWVRSGRVIISGFHSPLEQQVLISLLRRDGRAVKVLARGLGVSGYRPTPEEREPLAAGRLLVMSAFPTSLTRTTRESSLARNRLVLALAQELCIPYLSLNSPLRKLDQRIAQESGVQSNLG
jgi:predicted Rossmann fold nucleotide-binding protein DprA/Smf involved in DNA uptake